MASMMQSEPQRQATSARYQILALINRWAGLRVSTFRDSNSTLDFAQVLVGHGYFGEYYNAFMSTSHTLQVPS